MTIIMSPERKVTEETSIPVTDLKAKDDVFRVLNCTLLAKTEIRQMLIYNPNF